MLLRSLFIISSLIASIHATDDIDTLLDNFAQESDLSYETKIESGPISYIYTRQDIKNMQISSLKDVLKIIPYKESGFGMPDPFYEPSAQLPFSSSSIRIFLDNQELTSATYGSGFAHMGGINLSFVDHIEVYVLNPSFEFATEPTKILIKLFSLDSKRDKGVKVDLSFGSRDSNKESVTYIKSFDNWNLLLNASNNKDNREVYSSLNRDKDFQQALISLKNDKHKLQSFFMKKDANEFLNMSSDATPLLAKSDYTYTSFGYENNYLENLSFLFNYEKENSFIHYEDNYSLGSPFIPFYKFLVDSDNTIITSEVKYKFNTEDNNLLLGLKHRQKEFDTKRFEGPTVTPDYFDFNKQTLSSAYLENQYNLNDINLITFGYQFTDVNHNGGKKNYDLSLLRLGHTINFKNVVTKTFLYSTEYPVEPYLLQTGINLEPLKENALSSEIKYTNNNHSFRFIFLLTKTENDLTRNQQGTIVNIDESYISYNPSLEYIYTLDVNNVISAYLSYNEINNESLFNESKTFHGYIRSVNKYGKFNFFNELVYTQTDETYKNYWDYSFGVSYKYSDNLLLSLKGENIFNNAYEVEYKRTDLSGFIPASMDSLHIPTNDSKITLSLSYTF